MKKKSLICVLSCLIVLISLSANVYAKHDLKTNKKEIVKTRFTYIDLFYNSFDISQYGYASVNSYLSAHDVDQVKLHVYIQQYVNGHWQTIKSWTDTRDGTWNLIDSGWYVMSGYYYRCVSYGYVYINEEIVETTSSTSDLIFY